MKLVSNWKLFFLSFSQKSLTSVFPFSSAPEPPNLHTFKTQGGRGESLWGRVRRKPQIKPWVVHWGVEGRLSGLGDEILPILRQQVWRLGMAGYKKCSCWVSQTVQGCWEERVVRGMAEAFSQIDGIQGLVGSELPVLLRSEVKWKSLSHVRLFATNFPGQNSGVGSLSFLNPGDLLNPEIEPRSPALQGDSLPAEPQGKPKNTTNASQPGLFCFPGDIQQCLETFLVITLGGGRGHC